MNVVTTGDPANFQSQLLPYDPLLDSSSALPQIQTLLQDIELKRPDIKINFYSSDINLSVLPFPYASLPTLPFSPLDLHPQKTMTQIMPLEKAAEYYEENKEKFLVDFEGKYIAIINDNTYKIGSDLISVANSVYEEFGYQDIFITKVSREDEVIRLTHPRLIK